MKHPENCDCHPAQAAHSHGCPSSKGDTQELEDAVEDLRQQRDRYKAALEKIYRKLNDTVPEGFEVGIWVNGVCLEALRSED